DAIVRTIEREILTAIGRPDLPAPLQPVDFVLT
ncbi:MAG: bestrophin, partial [Pseudomonas sp.]